MFELNIGTEPEQLLLMGSLVLWTILFLMLVRPLSKTTTGRLFLFAFALLPSYSHLTLFFETEDMLSPAGVFDMWFRHVFFYLGQLFFFLFIFRLLGDGTDARPPRGHTGSKRAAGTVLGLLLLLLLPSRAEAHHMVDIFALPLTPYNVMLFLTDQGVPHLLVILFFFLKIAIVRTQQLYKGNEAAKQLVYFAFFADVWFIFLHIWEYLTESLHLFSSYVSTYGEPTEYLFQYTGIILLALVARRMKNMGLCSAK